MKKQSVRKSAVRGRAEQSLVGSGKQVVQDSQIGGDLQQVQQGEQVSFSFRGMKAKGGLAVVIAGLIGLAWVTKSHW